MNKFVLEFEEKHHILEVDGVEYMIPHRTAELEEKIAEHDANVGKFSEYENNMSMLAILFGEKAAKQNLPPPEYYSVSQNDCDSACGCAECKKFIQKYGVSGLVIDFTNRIAAEITKDYPDIKIQIFAYFDSLDIPKKCNQTA